ncbi:unnamed protein product [Clavelina lepadiformis]|uniref:Integrase catalytic domain-containing protein n=1 Tax=Clavelina lepadiformis TaxID=159417 RepID=A0ABP0G0V7_CLALP
MKYKYARTLGLTREKNCHNQHIRALLKTNKTTLYSTENEQKASIVERFNPTMKNKMLKHFT